jgi:hypothetical protein
MYAVEHQVEIDNVLLHGLLSFKVYETAIVTRRIRCGNAIFVAKRQSNEAEVYGVQ